MPSLAALHPQVVHFAVALLIVGVLFRFISLLGRWAWVNPAATTLLLMGTLAAALSVKSGADAHGPVERVPGARAAVVEHEEWGERARNIFLLVSAIELAGLALARFGAKTVRAASMASAVVGLAGTYVLYEAGEHGGELVYNYAGGVGIRSGDPEHVSRLLMAAAYHQAALDRQAGRADDAASLIETAARRLPNDPDVQLAVVDSLTTNRRDPAAALRALDAIRIPESEPRLRTRAGLLRASALEASGDLMAARQVLETLRTEFPNSPQIQRRLRELSDRK